MYVIWWIYLATPVGLRKVLQDAHQYQEVYKFSFIKFCVFFLL